MICSACRRRARRFSLSRSSSAIRARSAERDEALGPRRQRVEQAPVPLGAPPAERRGIQPLTPQVGADLSGFPQLVRLLQDAALVGGAEPPPPRPRGGLRVREHSARVGCPSARPPGSLRGRRLDADPLWICTHHQFLASPPSLISDGVMVSATLTQRATRPSGGGVATNARRNSRLDARRTVVGPSLQRAELALVP